MSDYVAITEGSLFKNVLADHPDVSKQNSRIAVKKIANRIKVNIFTGEYAVLYQAVKWCAKNNLPLTRDILQQLVSNSLTEWVTSPKVSSILTPQSNPSEQEEQLLLAVLGEHDVLLYEDVDLSLLDGEMELYLQSWYQQEMEQLIYQMDKVLREGLTFSRRRYHGAQDAHRFYSDKIALMNDVLHGTQSDLSAEVDTSIETGQSLLARIVEEQSDSQVVALTGIDALDRELDGLRKGETMVVQAGSGVGKTRFSAGTVGYSALMRGYNVLHISLEQQPTRIFPMYLARHIIEQQGEALEGLSDKGIMRNTYPLRHEGLVQEAIVDLVENPEYGRLMVVGRDLRAVELESYLNEVYDKFQFDVVILDYFGELRADAKTMYADFRIAASYLKSACKHFRGVGFLGVIVNQLTKEAETKLKQGDLTASKLAGADSSALLRGADVLVTLHQSADMELMGEMMLLVDKVRLGSVPNIKLKVDKGRCLFFEHIEESEEMI